MTDDGGMSAGGKSRLRRYILTGAALGLLVVLFAGGALYRVVHVIPSDARKVRLPIPVQTAPAKVQEVNRIIGASGTIQPSYPISITAKVVARIIEVPVNVGVIVKPGDSLVQLDPTLYQANVTKAQVTYDHAHKDLQRMESLAKRNFASPTEVETARDTDATAYASLVSAQIDLRNTRILSPAAAVVQVRYANPGETTKTDEELLQLGVLDPAMMDAAVSEDNAKFTYLGMHGEVGTDAYPGELFGGTVAKIDSVVEDTTRTFGAYIRLDNPGLRLKTGITGYARLMSSRMALTVPASAIINPVGDRASVFVVDDDKVAHLREVRFGATSGHVTEISSGLQEGEQVVAVGQRDLRDGDKVQINRFAPWN
jgi:RND family efflux transporter MFP subunit